MGRDMAIYPKHPGSLFSLAQPFDPPLEGEYIVGRVAFDGPRSLFLP